MMVLELERESRVAALKSVSCFLLCVSCSLLFIISLCTWLIPQGQECLAWKLQPVCRAWGENGVVFEVCAGMGQDYSKTLLKPLLQHQPHNKVEDVPQVFIAASAS